MGDTVIIRTLQGALKGKKVKTGESLQYYSFQGIPYAKPPVGPLRFKAPEPPESWTGIRDALSLGNVTPHFDIFQQKLVGDEDCLFLNVYTPKLNPKTPIPVMVWIHGGGLLWGSGNTDIYGPQPLMREEVILVTLNYRLHILGFLNVPGTDVSPNNGFKDQVAALKWVQKNISQFGGDPNNVTIFGESAGGFSVHAHVLSPMSKGLFHKAIPMSGTVLCLGPLKRQNPSKAFAVAKEAGYQGDNPQSLVAFLRRLSSEDIVNAYTRAIKNVMDGMGAVLEERGPDSFFVEDPLDIIRSGNFNRVPLIIGMTSAEGKLIYFMVAASSSISDMNDKLHTVLPESIKLKCTPEKCKEIAEKAKKFYFGENDISDETRDTFLDFLGDTLSYGVYRGVKEHVNIHSPIFYYLFSHEGKYCFHSLAGQTTQSPGKGAGHGDELFYLFQSDVVDNNHKPGTPDHKVSVNIAKLWANFAKTGNPNNGLDVEWIPATREDDWYLDINSELTVRRDVFKERMEFWDQIYEDCLGDKDFYVTYAE